MTQQSLPRSIRRILASAAIGVATIAGAAIAQDMMFGAEEDTAFAAALWAAMQEARLAGDGAIEARPYEGTEPHGAILQTLRATVEVEGASGALIVKRNYGPAGITIGEVWDDPAASLAAVTVMFQREEGYDADHGNWFWAKYLPDGTLDMTPEGTAMAGRVDGCIGCHQGAAGDDYQFLND